MYTYMYICVYYVVALWDASMDDVNAGTPTKNAGNMYLHLPLIGA